METVLGIVLATMALAIFLNVLLARWEIPTVIGYILSGAVAGQLFGLQHASHEGALYSLAELGIVFLMFTIGLEFSVRHLRAMRREVFLYGSLQMLVTGNLLGAFCHEILHLPLEASIIIGFSLALSSTAIVLKMLTERNELHSGYGRIALGILLFQDLAVIPILLLLGLFARPGENLPATLAWTALDLTILLLIVFVVGKYLLERFLAWTLHSDSEEIFLLAALGIVLAGAYASCMLGFGYSLGAFLAGMTLAETRFKYRIESDILNFRDLFLGVFFVTVGLRIDPSALLASLPAVAGALAGVLLLKAGVLYAILSRFIQRRTAFKAALALMQVGEFALAIFAIAAQEGIVDGATEQILIATVVLSMLLTPFVIPRLRALADRVFRREPEVPPIISSGMSDHVLLLGYGPLGQKLAQKLKTLAIPYLVLEHDYRLVEEARERNEAILLANAADRQILRQVGIDRACAVIVAIENPAKTRMVVDAVSSLAPRAQTVVAVRNESQKRIIETFPVTTVLSTSEIVSEAILSFVRQCALPSGNDSAPPKV